MRAHRLSASFILGYHGCSKPVADKLIDGDPFTMSQNDYDWLGHGVYFWEANPERALSFAREVQKKRGDSDGAAVVGAIIELGYCLDFLSESSVALVADSHRSLTSVVASSGRDMPKNSGGGDSLLRHLDCAVVNYLHASREDDGQLAFETVRGLFVEGSPIYEGSGFRRKTHIQICVRSPANIKGVFRVP